MGIHPSEKLFGAKFSAAIFVQILGSCFLLQSFGSYFWQIIQKFEILLWPKNFMAL